MTIAIWSLYDRPTGSPIPRQFSKRFQEFVQILAGVPFQF